MTPRACAMASLVEAQRDGRLGAREAGSLARHLETCAACRNLGRELDEVRELLRRPPVAPWDRAPWARRRRRASPG
jgi:anti-sigma factor RsiW